MIDLTKIAYETDVFIIGGGGAGTAAALTAQENGAKVLIATKLRHGDANTMMAEGGIQAATKGDKGFTLLPLPRCIGWRSFQECPRTGLHPGHRGSKGSGLAGKSRVVCLQNFRKAD